MKTATDLIERILDAAEERHPKVKIVSRHDYVHKTTGEKFGPLGIPFGMNRADLELGPAYWVFQASNGTTVGVRYNSEGAAIEARENYRLNRRNEFKMALEAMSEEEIESQANYWLGEDH